MAITLSRMIKKAACSVIPLANKTPCRIYTSAIFTTPLKTSTTISTSINNTTNLVGKVFRTTSIPTHHHFSAQTKKIPDSDDSLLKVIESEINWVEMYMNDVEVAALEIVELGNMGLEIPEFPFEIEDNAEEEYITLTRKYQDEEIKVTVKDRNC